MNCRWSIACPQPIRVAELAADLSLSPLLGQCLLNRGLTESFQVAPFLEPRLKQLTDPFLLPNMEKAVQRLFQAREQGESLVIFGDYDVDGVTSTALLVESFHRLGWSADYYLPHRFEEGYGLSFEAVQKCLQRFPATLLLAVDCGSNANTTIDWLKDHGVDTIVLDHHQVSAPPPGAVALVNPHFGAMGKPPLAELCSVGLAFKLVHALVKRGRQLNLESALSFDLRPLLDLVALGTIADLVPLKGENRILVTAGLERLNATRRCGLSALRDVARITGQIGVYEVGFQLGPRLNASGRMENALQSLQLLLENDAVEALRLAQALDNQNRERQQIERAITSQVLSELRSKFNPETDFVIVEGQLLWHIGVVGIVASRVLREFYRPTVIIGGEGSEWRGSGRSIDGFDLAGALGLCGDLLTRHGGHAMAAGLSIRPENVDLFRKRLNEIARQSLSAESFKPILELDAETGLHELTLASIRELNRLEPLGQGNPPVRLVARGLAHARPLQRMGKDQQHLKMWVTDGRSTHEALWWNCEAKRLPAGRFDLAFTPQIQQFNGQLWPVLKTLDWRPSC